MSLIVSMDDGGSDVHLYPGNISSFTRSSNAFLQCQRASNMLVNASQSSWDLKLGMLIVSVDK